MTDVSNGSAGTAYSYDADGNLTSTAMPDGLTESRGYDNADQLTSITDADGSTTLDAYGLTLNADGQPTQAAVTQDGTAQPTQYYEYGPGGAQISACYSATGESACSATSAGTATGTAPDPTAPGAPTGMVTSGIPGMCLDDAQGSSNPGTKVDLYTCTGAANTQQWTIASDGTVRIHGMCLDVKQNGTANGVAG
ncbi:MAG: ricin-type beta-trefoil lectin domain protein [Streptosporangiaceae bacterium]